MTLLTEQFGVGLEAIKTPVVSTLTDPFGIREESLAWEGPRVMPVEVVITPVWLTSTGNQATWDPRLFTATLRWQMGTAFQTSYTTDVDTETRDIAVPASGLRMRLSARRVTIDARIFTMDSLLLGPMHVRLAIAPVDSIVHPRPIPACTGTASHEGTARVNLFPIGAREFRIWPSDLTLYEEPDGPTQIVVYYPDGETPVQTLDLLDVSDDFCPIAFEGAWWSALDAVGGGLDSPLIVEYR